MTAAFSLPRRTAVAPEVAEAYAKAERAAEPFVSALVASAPDAPKPSAEPMVAPNARLSVDIPAAMLRRLKVRAIEQRVSVREYVYALLAKDGLA